MSFDIYGNRLARGHCEVHPHVGEEYPCSICCAESARRDHEIAAQEQTRRDFEDAYYARMFGDIELDSWIAPPSRPTPKETP